MRERFSVQLRSALSEQDATRYFVQEIKLREASPGKPKQPPTEFRIFAYGRNRATHIGHAPEDVWLDEASADAVIAEWKRRKIKLVIDYEHASIKGVATGAPNAGRFDLEKRSDGLWAVNVTWTKRATDFLLADEYLYFSQGFTQRYDKTTNKFFVATIFHLALVNVPASDDQPLLMRSAAQQWVIMEELYDQIITALGISIDETQAAALKSVLAAHGEMMSAKTAAATPAEPDEKMSAITNAAMRITGKSSPVEVIGLLEAYKDGYVKAGQLVKTRAAADTSELDKLLDAAQRQGKVEPERRAELRAACIGPTGQVKPDALAILKVRLNAAVATGIGASVAESASIETPALNSTPAPRDPQNIVVTLTAADREVAKLFGHSEEDIKAQRTKEKIRLG
jgi:phage I-like protein